MRLIDADALLEKLSEKNAILLSALIEEQRTTAFYVYFKVVDAIEKMPTIEAEPVRHGHWKKISPAGIYECSNCKQDVMTADIEVYKYCHRCRAKMDEATP